MLGKKGVEKVAKVEKECKNKTTHQIKRLFDYQRERERERDGCLLSLNWFCLLIRKKKRELDGERYAHLQRRTYRLCLGLAQEKNHLQPLTFYTFIYIYIAFLLFSCMFRLPSSIIKIFFRLELPTYFIMIKLYNYSINKNQ